MPNEPLKVKSSRALVIGSSLLLVVLLAGAWFTRTYYYNFFFGPFAANGQMILAIAEHPGQGELLSYVELKDQTLIPTGWTEKTTWEKNDVKRLHTEFAYVLLRVGDRLLLVLASKEEDGKHLVGPLYAIFREVDRTVVEALQSNLPEGSPPLLPIMLNSTAAFPVIGYLGLSLAIPLALLCLVNFYRGMKRTRRNAG